MPVPVIGAPGGPLIHGRLLRNSSMLESVGRSRIAKKNVSAQRTVATSTGLVKRTIAPANGDTNSLRAGCTPFSGNGVGENARKLRGSSRPSASPAVNSATQTARGALATSHASRAVTDDG